MEHELHRLYCWWGSFALLLLEVHPAYDAGGELIMFERLTDRARKVMALANQEAQRFNHEYIGTEHILAGSREGRLWRGCQCA